MLEEARRKELEQRISPDFHLLSLSRTKGTQHIFSHQMRYHQQKKASSLSHSLINTMPTLSLRSPSLIRTISQCSSTESTVDVSCDYTKRSPKVTPKIPTREIGTSPPASPKSRRTAFFPSIFRSLVAPITVRDSLAPGDNGEAEDMWCLQRCNAFDEDDC